MTARGLRILCYHGMSLLDEHEFHGQLFMRPELFRKRMTLLAARGFRVMALATATEALQRGTLPDRSVVLTFDDGWYGTFRHALPILLELGMPATIYVTTYHAARRTPVFEVAISYLLWRTKRAHIDLSTLRGGLTGRYDLRNPSHRTGVAHVISAHGDAHLSAQERQDLLRELAVLLQFDPDLFDSKRLCGLMTMEEIALAASSGFDIQLHTHRHLLSTDDRAGVRREITDNRTALGGLGPRPLTHLAYPGGVWHPRMLPWLTELGVETATTTEPGLNYPHTGRLALGRFLDGENIAPIEFEAELDGGLEILRRLRADWRGRFGLKPARGIPEDSQSRRPGTSTVVASGEPGDDS